MNAYKVNMGMHREGDRTFKKGQVIRTPHELDKMFPLKFSAHGATAAAAAIAEEDEEPAPAAAGPAKAKTVAPRA